MFAVSLPPQKQYTRRCIHALARAALCSVFVLNNGSYPGRWEAV